MATFIRRTIHQLGRWASALAVPLIVLGALAAALVLWSGRDTGKQAGAEIWTCSMHPQVRLPQAGDCPLCGMDLIPLSALDKEKDRVEQRAGLVTAAIKPRELFKEIRTVGKLDYNERRVAFITARIAGRVERVFADFAGIQVKRNDHLVTIYSPELYVAQAELLRAVEAQEQAKGDRRFSQAQLEAARTKLRLLGILPEQIAEIEKSRKELTHLTIYAPIGGVVVEKNVREQQYVQAGDPLYRIAELDPIWLYLDVYESDLPWVRYGQTVDVTVEAFPGETFHGTVVFIDPYLDDTTRTVKARVNLKNPGLRLKPAMYASAQIHVRLRSDGTPEPTGLEGKFICPMHPEVVRDAGGECPICEMPLEQVPDLFPVRQIAGTQQPSNSKSTVASNGPPAGQALAIPRSAVLTTGRRQVTYRKRKDGVYELVDLTLGPLAEGKDDSGRTITYFPVLSGLKTGDQVAVQGGFLLDSQRQIEGMPSLLQPQGGGAADLHAGHGGPAPPSKAAPAHKH